MLKACTPASVRLEIVNLTGSTEFSRLAASCGNPRNSARSVGRAWSSDRFFPLNRSSL